MTRPIMDKVVVRSARKLDGINKMPIRDRLDYDVPDKISRVVLALERDCFEGLVKKDKPVVYHELLESGQTSMKIAGGSGAFYYTIHFVEPYRMVINNWSDLTILELVVANSVKLNAYFPDRGILKRILDGEQLAVVINQSKKKSMERFRALWSDKNGREPL